MARPLFWRLPLVVFVLVGILGILRIDALLRRDAEREAELDAEQVQALLGAHLRDRASYLHALSIALASLGDGPPSAARFVDLARELHATAPEVAMLALLDTSGRVRERLVRGAAVAPLGAGNRDVSSVERAVAVAASLRKRRTSMTPTVPLREGMPGFVLFDPIVRGDKVVGLVSAGIAHQTLFGQALAARFRGRFIYRVLEADGEVIAKADDWPSNPQRVVAREVALPDDRRWTVEVAMPRFVPVLPRLLNGLAGAALIIVVVGVVLREAARSERLAEHSLQLELLSRDLLDANVRLEERAAQVAEANRAKSRFLANVSHELRTPINAIVGYNALALDGMYGGMPPALHDAHDRIRLASRHLLALVDDVLDLSKIEAGRMALEPAPVNLASILDGVAAIVEPIATAKGVHLDVVLGRDLPRLTTDARHLRQVLLNLASNAVKFTERGIVTLVARRDPADPEHRVLVAVEDTGVGIALADQQRIFDEFEQVLDGARGDSLRRGTGLGLPIARKLARLLGGDVQVESAPGVGSRFTLTLPIEPAGPATASESGKPESVAATIGAPRRVDTPVPPRVTPAEVERALARARELTEDVGTSGTTGPSGVSGTTEAPSARRASPGSGVDAPNPSD